MTDNYKIVQLYDPEDNTTKFYPIVPTKAIPDFDSKVQDYIQQVIGTAPEALNTLEEIAKALKNNADILDNYVTIAGQQSITGTKIHDAYLYMGQNKAFVLGRNNEAIYLDDTHISWHNASNSYTNNIITFERYGIALNQTTTLANTKQLTRAGYGSSWKLGRDAAMIRQNTYTGYNPILSTKSQDGSWELGTYRVTGDSNRLYLSYILDSNYSGGDNVATAQYIFGSNGIFIPPSISTTGSVTANSFIKSGGTNQQVLLANGDVLPHSSNWTTSAKTLTTVSTDGVMEAGRYIDFHYPSSDTKDYSIRLQVPNVTGKTVILPSDSGTLALTNNVPKAYTYTVAANSGVRITYEAYKAVYITMGSSRGNSTLILLGEGYGVASAIRHKFYELATSAHPNYSWCIPEDSSIECCVEVFNNISDVNAYVHVISTGSIIFTAISTLSGDDQSYQLVKSSSLGTLSYRSVHDINMVQSLGFDAGQVVDLVTFFNKLIEVGFRNGDILNFHWNNSTAASITDGTTTISLNGTVFQMLYIGTISDSTSRVNYMGIITNVNSSQRQYVARISKGAATEVPTTVISPLALYSDIKSGTVTSLTLTANSPLSIDNTSAITTSGTRTLSHNTSGITAGTYKSVTVDAYGHVTAGSNPTTLSGYGITDAKIASGIITLGSNTITPITSVGIRAGATGTATNGVTTNGNTFIKILGNSAYKEQIKIVGTGATSVTSDNNGVITIDSTDNNTDTKVQSIASNDNENYPILLNSTTSATTGTVKMNSNATINPSTGNLKVTQINSVTVGSSPKFSDTNYYHTTGSWNGLTYTATANGGAGALALTLPTGTSATTVAVGNHTHSISLLSYSGSESTIGLAFGSSYQLTAGGESIRFTLPTGGSGVTTPLVLTANRYMSNSLYSLSLNGSDIVGLNGLYWADPSNSKGQEGLNFPRTGGNYDAFYMLDGNGYFTFNHTIAGATSATSYTILHSGNWQSYVTSNSAPITTNSSTYGTIHAPSLTLLADTLTNQTIANETTSYTNRSIYYGSVNDTDAYTLYGSYVTTDSVLCVAIPTLLKMLGDAGNNSTIANNVISKLTYVLNKCSSSVISNFKAALGL